MFPLESLGVLGQGSIPSDFGLRSSPRRGPQGLISVCYSFSCATAAEGSFLTDECRNFYLGCAGVVIKGRLLGMEHFQSSTHH